MRSFVLILPGVVVMAIPFAGSFQSVSKIWEYLNEILLLSSIFLETDTACSGFPLLREPVCLPGLFVSIPKRS